MVRSREQNRTGEVRSREQNRTGEKKKKTAEKKKRKGRDCLKWRRDWKSLEIMGKTAGQNAPFGFVWVCVGEFTILAF